MITNKQTIVPGSNVTIDEAMILFTGRSIHITKMPNCYGVVYSLVTVHLSSISGYLSMS